MRQSDPRSHTARRRPLGRATLAGLLIAVMAPLGVYAQARTMAVTGSASFVSDAPLETIRGRSSRVSGSVNFDPSNLSSASGTVQIPVSSINTGVALRDQHLRGSDWLDAANHPNITFTLQSVEGASSLTPDQEARVTLRGTINVHGVARPARARARVKLISESNTLRVRARFTVNLPAHGVTVPALVRAKVSDEITVNVNLTAR